MKARAARVRMQRQWLKQRLEVPVTATVVAVVAVVEFVTVITGVTQMCTGGLVLHSREVAAVQRAAQLARRLREDLSVKRAANVRA